MAGVSAFGFGGTNFHAVIEEHVPGRLTTATGSALDRRARRRPRAAAPPEAGAPAAAPRAKPPLRGALVLGAADDAALANELRTALAEARQGRAPRRRRRPPAALARPERVAIDYADADELAAKASSALSALEAGNPADWRALRARGVFLGRGRAGQGRVPLHRPGLAVRQHAEDLREREPIVADDVRRGRRDDDAAARGRPLSDFIFVDPATPTRWPRPSSSCCRTEITQPAVLATDIALTRLLGDLRHHPRPRDGALASASTARSSRPGALTFEAALEAVSARGQRDGEPHVEDNGAMAAVLAPLDEVERVVAAVDGYVVIANVNRTQPGRDRRRNRRGRAGGRRARRARPHGHAAAGQPRLPHVDRRAGQRAAARDAQPSRAEAPVVPIVANVDGELYPTGADVQEQMLDILARQVASPVQFVKGLRTLYAQGARVFVEVGPKKALHGFVEDVLGATTTCRPVHQPSQAGRRGRVQPGAVRPVRRRPRRRHRASTRSRPRCARARPRPRRVASAARPPRRRRRGPADDRYRELGRLLVDFLDRGRELMPAPTRRGARAARPRAGRHHRRRARPARHRARLRRRQPRRGSSTASVHRRDPAVCAATMRTSTSRGWSRATRARGSTRSTVPTMWSSWPPARGAFDLVEEFGVDADRDQGARRLTRGSPSAPGSTRCATPGSRSCCTTRRRRSGTQLPDRWGLPDVLRDDTGVIFASAFPGLEEIDRRSSATRRPMRRERARRAASDARRMLDHEGTATSRSPRSTGASTRSSRLLEAEPFEFDRRFLFRVLSMGHSQFAEIIGARGPNTQVNSACASTTQAVALAEDWIRAGRCRRVVIVAADNVTSDTLLEWMGSGFLATGAAATDEVVEEAAVPFDNRRHGMLLGMGAAGIVVESAEAARERGIQPICEVLGSVTANSAFHGTRLDVDHIAQVMEDVVAQAEARGVRAPRRSHPRPCSSRTRPTRPRAAGAPRPRSTPCGAVFGDDADRVVIANTKGFTGHPMGVGIEDVVAIKALETGIVPPVPNFKEVDPCLGELNLSIGGAVSRALCAAAGRGLRLPDQHGAAAVDACAPTAARRNPDELGYPYRIVDRDAWRRWLRRDDAATTTPSSRSSSAGCESSTGPASRRRTPPSRRRAAAPRSVPRPEPGGGAARA